MLLTKKIFLLSLRGYDKKFKKVVKFVFFKVFDKTNYAASIDPQKIARKITRTRVLTSSAATQGSKGIRQLPIN